jgi:hypothetical protein
MNRSEEIYFDTGQTPTDKYIKVRLENENDTFEILTLRIDTKEAYQDFNADYGVLVGRVTANGGVGIPNAKISIFLPLEEEDEDDGDIVGIYPYKTPRDKNAEGKRYNLLPRVSLIDPNTGEVKPKQPFGSFPIKPEIVTNPNFLKVYKKYYKYTAVTNEFGDYMIFGVPVGTQTVHMSVDITDIGKYSMTPAAMVTNLGYSPNLFIEDRTRIKPSTDLDDLPNIETQEISVDVIPFWGDKETFDIGITRQDFRIRAELVNTFVIFGSVYTDPFNSTWGEDFPSDTLRPRELWRARDPSQYLFAVGLKRIGNITENIYYYPTEVTDEEIQNGDPKTLMRKLSPSEYSVYKRDGDFVFIINCNRRKIITGPTGEEVVVSNNSTSGVFTTFRGFITLEITEDDVPIGNNYEISDQTLIPYRYKIKIPQSAPKGLGIEEENDDERARQWRRKTYEFTGGTLFSIAKFHGLVHNNDEDKDDFNNDEFEDDFFKGDDINIGDIDPNWNVGIIETSDRGDFTGNTAAQMPTNTSFGSRELFGGNWMNFSIHLPQGGYVSAGDINRLRDMQTNTNFTNRPKSFHFLKDNTQEIVGGDFNTRNFARSDLHWTDFIYTPKEDLIKILQEFPTRKGFIDNDLIDFGSFSGKYKYGGDDVPNDGGVPLGGAGKRNADPSEDVDPRYYFFRGVDSSDSIQYLRLLGII